MLFVLGIIIGTILALPILMLFTGNRINRLEATIRGLKQAAQENQCQK